MNTIYKDEAEAQKKADEINNAIREVPGIFCPLTVTKCRTDCVCWQKAYVYNFPVGGVKGGELRFRVQGWNCGNQMFFRECNHEI